MPAKFFYYPYPAGNRLEVIEIDTIGEMYSEFRKDGSGGTSLDGASYRSVGLTQEIITIQRDRMKGSEDLAHKFQALQTHLDKGYTCSFAQDDTKAFCGYLLTSPLNSGSTSLEVSGNPFASFVGSSVLSAGDYIVMETQPPASIYEINKVSSVSAGFSSTNGGTITLDRPCSFRYDQDTWIRFYRFLPICKRVLSDIGKNMITNEHGLLWSLEIRLEIDYAGLFSFIPMGPEKTQETIVFPDETGSDYYSGFEGLDLQMVGRRESQINQVDLEGINTAEYFGSQVRGS